MIPKELVPYQDGYKLEKWMRLSKEEFLSVNYQMREEGYRYTGMGIWRPK